MSWSQWSQMVTESKAGEGSYLPFLARFLPFLAIKRQFCSFSRVSQMVTAVTDGPRWSQVVTVGHRIGEGWVRPLRHPPRNSYDVLRPSAPPAARPRTRAATPRATPHRVHRPRGCAAARSCARKVHARERARWHRSLLCFRTVHSARAERSERRRIGSAGSAGVPVDQCRPTCDDRLTSQPQREPKISTSYRR